MTPVLRPCPVCGCCEAKPIHMNAMAALDGLDMSYRVAGCPGCGFAFADHLPPVERYDRYYRSLSKYDIVDDGSGISPTDSIRCAATVDLLRNSVPTTAAIADLGCGSGVLLAALRNAGWTRLAGIDPAPAAPQQARARFGIENVRSGRLAQAGTLLDLHHTDLVCLTGVMEHLPALRHDMETLVANLAEHTHILVEVPALERFASRPCEPFGEFSLEHIQYFSTSSLVRFLATLGYEPRATRIVELPAGSCDSLFGVFARAPLSGTPVTPVPCSDDGLADYVVQSEACMAACLAKISASASQPLVLYGAGSHTARLLPRLSEPVNGRIASIVDRNPNLHGKRLGRFAIEPPEALAGHPSATIVVSAFRGQQIIADMLRASRPNPVLTLY